MNTETLGTFLRIADILLKLVALVGGIWALYKVKEYRELKQRVQLDISANLYKLSSPENVAAFTWDKEGKRISTPMQPHTHAVEVLLRFTNKGLTRMRLYNIQVGMNTMRPQNKAQFDKDDGHLHLTRILTSGNIVPLFRVEGMPVEKTSFYYVEPGVEQTITYLALIPEPRELIQVYARFSLEQERIFPQREVGAKRLFPHTAARTYQVDADGLLVK